MAKVGHRPHGPYALRGWGLWIFGFRAFACATLLPPTPAS